jgi:two-component system, OmpR family, phosphate regulon sensor histidine kinase PhoR
MIVHSKSFEDILNENEELRIKLSEAEDAIEAIRFGQVDALVVNTADEHRVFTLTSADQTYRVFIERMNEGAVTLNNEGVILYSNSFFAQMLDLPLEQVIGSNFYDYVTDDCSPEFKKLFLTTFQKDSKGEVSIIGEKKKIIPCLVSLTRLYLEKKDVISIILTDLSFQKAAENDLKDLNIVLEEAERLSKIGSWQLDLITNKVTRSKELYIIYGLDSEKDIQEFIEFNKIHPEDRKDYINSLNEAIKAGDPFEMNVRIITADGDIKFVLIRGKVIRENGKSVRVLGSTQDVSIIKKIEKQLKEKNALLLNAQKITDLLNHELEDKVQERTKELLLSKEHFRYLADNIPQVIWQSKANGDMVFFNKHWFDFTGLSVKDTYGWGWQSVIHPEDREENLKKYKSSLETGKSFLCEQRFKNKNGEYRWHLGRGHAMLNDNSTVQMWIGTYSDIHDQKMAMERKDDFIGMASHELKTPLSSAKAYLQLLQRNVTDPANKIYVEKANKQIVKLNELISDLLDVTKIQSGKLELNKSSFDCDTFIKECIESFQHTTSTHQITLEGKVLKKLVADQHRIEQVLINFLSNAVKYAPKANKILVTLDSDDKRVSVSIHDYGIGIPEEKLANVFQKFYRVEGVSKNFEGLGIGLFISSEIINRHGGSVKVTSTEGSGSIFTFTLPF